MRQKSGRLLLHLLPATLRLILFLKQSMAEPGKGIQLLPGGTSRECSEKRLTNAEKSQNVLSSCNQGGANV